MNERCKSLIKNALNASNVTKGTVLQPLWSGYGEVYRANLTDADVSSVIVKHINPEANDDKHPRGWHSQTSVQRKLKSYEVEQSWYEQYANCCDNHCKVPTCHASDHLGQERWIVLEDLDVSGYPLRFGQLKPEQCLQCLQWLAHFHAIFLNNNTGGLWPIGTYWHLATRQQEWHACTEPELKKHAHTLSELLNQCTYKTLVHGDAKVANFCFSDDGPNLRVAAVDFQYTGSGCGIRDVAYFLGSCLSDRDCHTSAADLLDCYFDFLEAACRQRPASIEGDEFRKIEEEWRGLYVVAWADFHRFLAGWSPDHVKINDYAQRQTRIALDSIN